MGKALRPEHIAYFTTRMDEHSRVKNWEPIENEEEYLFRIRRTLSGRKSDVIVHLTDAYRYGRGEFIARPNQLGTGSYVVIGMPHASADPEVIELAKDRRIGVGHIGRFMGALNYRKIWEYMTPEELRQQAEQLQRRGTKAQS